jgi:tetratricopeptide (TPR) repeat protein
MSRFSNLEFHEQPEQSRRQLGSQGEEQVWLAEAEAACARGEFEQALRDYARVLEYNPFCGPAWAGQVRMLLELGDYDEANRWADRGLDQLPREPQLLAAKAVAMARLGDLQAALLFSDAAVEEATGAPHPYVWLARGDVLLTRKERRAEHCFTRAFEVAPGQWLWAWFASRIHYFHRKFALALKFVSQALAWDAAQGVIWLQMGRCQLALGLVDAAEGSLRQAQQLAPRSAEVAAALNECADLGWWSRVMGQCRCWLQR